MFFIKEPLMEERSRIFTIGSSNRSVVEFIEMLRSNGVRRLIDVRSKTGSRTLHFDERRFGNLSRILADAGIEYDSSLHLKLGGQQNGQEKMTLKNFRAYTHTLGFAEALEDLIVIATLTEGNSAIMCCERDPRQCHRKVIADELEQRHGWEIIHL